MSLINVPILIHDTDLALLGEDLEPYVHQMPSMPWIAGATELEGIWLCINAQTGFVFPLRDVFDISHIDAGLYASLMQYADDCMLSSAQHSFCPATHFYQCNHTSVEITQRLQCVLKAVNRLSVGYAVEELFVIADTWNEKPIQLPNGRYSPEEALEGVMRELHDHYEDYVESTPFWRVLLDMMLRRHPWLEE